MSIHSRRTEGGGDYTVKLTGTPFDAAYRYVNWLLIVRLLKVEQTLEMELPAKHTTVH